MGKYKHKDYYEMALNNISEVNWITREVLKEPKIFSQYIEILPCEFRVIFHKEGMIKNNYTKWLKLKARFFTYRYKCAEWIGGELGECSNCGHKGCASDIWNDCKNYFCPNCGKEMVNLK